MMEKLAIALVALLVCEIAIAEEQCVLKAPTSVDVVEGGKTVRTDVLQSGTIVQVVGPAKKKQLTKEEAELRIDSFLGFKFKSREYVASPNVKKIADGEYICKLEKPLYSFKYVKLSCTTNGALYGVTLEMRDDLISVAGRSIGEPKEHVVYTGSESAVADMREKLADWVRDTYKIRIEKADVGIEQQYVFENSNTKIMITHLRLFGNGLQLSVFDSSGLKIHKEEETVQKKIQEEQKKAEELRKKAEAAAKEAERKAKIAAGLAVKIPGYDPLDPAERAKADEKIVAFLREHTGHSFGDDFAAAGFSTNESTVTFPARKPFGIFDEVEVSQIAEEGRYVSLSLTGKMHWRWSRRPTGKIQSFRFKTSQKNVVTNVTYLKLGGKVKEMQKPIGRDLARRVDLQEDYFDLHDAYCVGLNDRELKKRLDRQKSVRKPYPNIRMYLSYFCRDVGRSPISLVARDWPVDLTLTFDRSKKIEGGAFGKHEDEIVIEWREEQRQFMEIDKCYSHGISVDESKTNRWQSASPEVDIHFITAFKQMSGFEIGQGYVSGVLVTTNSSMGCEVQEVDMPVKIGVAKKEQLLFKKGRLYGVCVQVPFCEASRKMMNRPDRVVEAERDGVWNEMDSFFDIGHGSVWDRHINLNRYETLWYSGWNVLTAPIPGNAPERIDLSVTFDRYCKELCDGTKEVIVDVERLRNLNDEEKKSYAQTLERALRRYLEEESLKLKRRTGSRIQQLENHLKDPMWEKNPRGAESLRKSLDELRRLNGSSESPRPTSRVRRLNLLGK